MVSLDRSECLRRKLIAVIASRQVFAMSDPFGGAHVLGGGSMISRLIRDSVVEILEKERDIQTAARKPGSGPGGEEAVDQDAYLVGGEGSCDTVCERGAILIALLLIFTIGDRQLAFCLTRIGGAEAHL